MSRSHARATSALVGALSAGVLGGAMLIGAVGSAQAATDPVSSEQHCPNSVSSPDPHVAPLGRGHWGGHRYWGNNGWHGNWGGGWGNGWGNGQGNGWGNNGWHGGWGGGNSQN